MKKFLPLGLAALLAGCSLVAPYTITFTNTPGAVVSPSTTTLDLVVSQPTLAYISDVECEGADSVEFLPIVDQDEEPSTLHKLPLTALEGMPSGASCEVTVTVFDPTTTETAASSIELTMEGEAVVEEDVEEDTEETSDEEEASSGEESSEPTEETSAETETTVEVETPVETPTESTETPSETNDSAESTDTTGTEEQGA